MPTILLLLLPLFCSQISLARLFQSLPDDLYSSPKYSVTFLNGLPLLNETAERWLREGLYGGEPEFLDHPTQWQDPPPFKHIDAGDGTTQAQVKSTQDYTIELMKMGPRDTYLCFIPPSTKQEPQPPEESITEVPASHSWSLLQPLDGTCLYHRQGWFTYAYCHNSHVRQFREMIHSRPMVPGKAYEIEEDPDWEAYDLGRAPESSSSVDLSRADHGAVTANLELARGTGSRYLVQRWGDGTVCDKTGKRREIEVQFHCSMTMTDSIMFVKETKTCHYILVINTPRLCGEPGFKSRVDQHEEALIRCREVVDAATLANADNQLPESNLPYRQRRAPASSNPPPPLDAAENRPGRNDDSTLDQNDLLRRALETILQNAAGNPAAGIGAGAGGGVEPRVVVEDVGDGEMLIEFISEVQMNDRADLERSVEELSRLMDSNMFEDALRAVGFDVRDEGVEVEVEVEAEHDEERKQGDRTRTGAAKGRRRANVRDEL
ncbi:hypothetical protein EI94DRAFT_1768293 [Lactarius quietus]|nr:hypothetical protein EI94DRAFT_1768293 [Lactarius quietus]